MIDHHLPYELTPEDKRVRAKWARGVAIVYGSILLLLVTLIASQQFSAEPETATAVATAPTKAVSQVGRN